MANDWLYSVRVNQKLAFARILLKSAEQVSGDDIPAKQSVHAYLDSAMGQVRDALMIFCVEIASQHQSKIDIDFYSLSQILKQLQEQGVDNALNRELEQLMKRQGWLNDLLQASKDPRWLDNALATQFSNTNKTSSQNNSLQAQSSSTIPAINVDASLEQAPIVRIKQWQQAIQTLVERHRNLIVED